MKSLDSFKNRIFLRKIILFVTSGFTVMITVFTIILYFFVEGLVIRIENESNNNLMTQVQYNMRFIEQTIKNTCEHLYLNSDVSYIMNMESSDSDFEEGMIRMNMVWKSIKDANPFIHSIYIYNNNTHNFFSSYNGMLFKDIGLLEYMKDQETIPRMAPVFRKIKGDKNFFGAAENVMSYFIYDTYDRETGMKNGIVVNVRLQWLLDNLDQSAENNQLFLMDNNGDFVNKENKEPFLMLIKSSYNEYVQSNSSHKDDGFFTTTYKGDKYFVFYYHIDNATATVFKAIPYKEIHAYVYQLQKIMMLLFLIFLALTIVESLIISKRIYNPFGSMINKIRSNNKNILGTLDDRDEILFLNTVYNKNAEMLETYKNEIKSSSSIIKTSILRSLLIDGPSIESEELERFFKGSEVSIETSGRYAVCVIKIDRYDESMHLWNIKERDLIKFAILNIGCEIIGRQYVNDGLDMGEDCVCIILCTKDGNPMNEKATELIREIQTVLRQHYDISITVTFSEIVESLNNLPKAYTQALENSYYRYIFGRQAIIFPEQIAMQEEGSIHELHKMEKRLYTAIMSGDIEKVEQELKCEYEQLIKFKYEEVTISQVQLLRTMSQAITELNRNRLDIININFNELYHMSFHIETMKDMFSYLQDLFEKVLNKDKGKMIESRHALLIDTVMAIINEKYGSSGLCLDEIALSLNISTRQLSRIFKNGTGRTIPEQISEVRLAKAADLIEHSSLNVSEVALKVGIESETYFYSVFKKKYGTTPKEYKAMKSLKNSVQ